MTKKMISIIVPVYNGEKYLSRTIESLINQTYNNLEIILINDGSTDNSLSICNKYSKIDNRIKVFDKINGGVSSARNYGINHANGEYIFFIDADDTVSLNAIEIMVCNLNSDDLIGINAKIISNSEKDLVYSSLLYEKNIFIKNMFSGCIKGFCWGYLFKTDVCKKILFNENISYCEDLLFLYYYVKCSGIKNIRFVPSVFYNYYVNDDGITCSNSNYLKKVDSICSSIKKINELSDNEYYIDLNNLLIYLLEYEMKKCKKISDYKYITDNYPIIKYSGKNVRYIIFSILYIKKDLFLLKIYYLFRNVIKFMKG